MEHFETLIYSYLSIDLFIYIWVTWNNSIILFKDPLEFSPFGLLLNSFS